MDDVIAQLRPGKTYAEIADVVTYPHRPRGKNRNVGAALALQFQLGALETSPGFHRH